MATENLSAYDPSSVPDGSGMRIALIVSEWNPKITSGLASGALDALGKCGVKEADILTLHVPGSFELANGAQLMIEKHQPDGVICLGSVIQGETRHFEFVCSATAQGIMDVSIKYAKPVIFGVLTDDNLEQARARSGGKLGNKGVECAIACIKMVAAWKK